MNIVCEVVDFTNSKQTSDWLDMLDSYAKDPMGSGKPLDNLVRKNLAQAMASRPHALAIIAYAGGKAAGMANCFEGFSTFKCKPLINIHDLAVAPQFRGKGVSKHLLNKIREIAVDKGCCKITLEVLQGNQVAKQAYLNYGFEAYELDPKLGQALFWEMTL